VDNTPHTFYNALAADYDIMTEFDRRFRSESLHFAEIVNHFKLKSALDAGCGSGLHSFVLARMGIRVTAVDVSKKMLDQMKRNSERLGIDVRLVRSSLTELKGKIKDSYDSVFCLGNTLAHLLTKSEMLAALKAFRSALNSGGILIIQLLNYDRILKSRTRIQNVKIAGKKSFIRFYDFEEKNIRFNLLKMEREGQNISHSLISVRLYPWRRNELSKLLRHAGFAKIGFFSDIRMSVFDKRTSRDLVIAAEK
jgi:glycine/sarcosine N-methyltransferase